MLYTAQEVAEMLQTSRAWVYALVQMKRLMPAKNRPLLFTQEEIERYQSNHDVNKGDK
jgi:predicted DNA-binding transcriptional regulator AlpA